MEKEVAEIKEPYKIMRQPFAVRAKGLPGMALPHKSMARILSITAFLFFSNKFASARLYYLQLPCSPCKGMHGTDSSLFSLPFLLPSHDRPAFLPRREAKCPLQSWLVLILRQNVLKKFRPEIIGVQSPANIIRIE